MSKATLEQFNELAELKFSKNDIAAARAGTDLRFKLIKAMYAQTKASQAYSDWCDNMIELYGDGECVLVVKIPPDELKRSKKIEKAFRKAYADADRIEAEIRKRIEEMGRDA